MIPVPRRSVADRTRRAALAAAAAGLHPGNPGAEAAAWSISQDAASGAPLYEFQCATCRKMSKTSEGGPLAPEVWALRHTALHPSHRSYCSVVTSFWRVALVGEEVRP
ncbi:hypothetical protein [Streptomyces luteireticuli]|uniref:DUF7848 domain-containing protein n=1 Tax=Streptomyces luteireticuli TaxID=173858 RepID=UPI003558E2BA